MAKYSLFNSLITQPYQFGPTFRASLQFVCKVLVALAAIFHNTILCIKLDKLCIHYLVMEILDMYNKLLETFGRQHWWPADKPFEVVVGAILTQNTSWNNAALAISNLKEASILDPSSIVSANKKKLKLLVRPSGFYNQKADRLKAVARYIVKRGGISKLAKMGTAKLRKELLNIRGIGKETADSILLYALEKPVFVVDAYTKRIFERTGIINKKASSMTYDEVQTFVEKSLNKRNPTRFYKEFHALLVALAKQYCKTKPLCGSCPLKCK
jgi:endonuclease-3 related protein